MNKVHRINGFVYVTSEEEIRYLDYKAIFSTITGNFIEAEQHKNQDDAPSNQIKIILTNDSNLTTVQQLTSQEVDYLNGVDECEVESKITKDGVWTDLKGYVELPTTHSIIHKIIIPKKEPNTVFVTTEQATRIFGAKKLNKMLKNHKQENDYSALLKPIGIKQETIEAVANKYSGYHKSYIDETDVKGSAFLDGYNHALKTLYLEEEVLKLVDYLFHKYASDFRVSAKIDSNEWFNQNKKK